MTLDLLALVLPHLSPADMNALFNLCLSADVLESKDNAVQKRGYKILAKAAGSGKTSVTVEETIQRLEKLTEGLASAAKKVKAPKSTSIASLLTALAGPLLIAKLSGQSHSSHQSACHSYHSD